MNLSNTSFSAIESFKPTFIDGCSYYSLEDQYVWKTMVSNIVHLIKKNVKDIYFSYLERFKRLPLYGGKIRTIDSINEQLSVIGWKAIYVDGFVSAQTYVQLQSHQICPVSKNIRKMKHIDHSAPDFAHDVLGHLPMLFSEGYREVLKSWALEPCRLESSPLDDELYKATLTLIDAREVDKPNFFEIEAWTEKLRQIYSLLNKNPSLSKLYAWSFEFGVLKEDCKMKIIEAAILSSTQEIRNVCEKK